MIVKDITDYIESLFPLETAAGFDNPGLLVGSKNTEVTLDGVTTVITNKAQGTENSGNIALFNRSITNPNTSRNIGAKVYAFYIKDSGALVCNFIPAKRNSDGVIGMYDTVTETFFTNSGTGEFIAGPEIE